MLFKRILISLFFLVISMFVFAQQQTADIGFLGGGAIPFCDYSKMNIDQSVHFNSGFFYRYNYNSRYAFRFNAMYGSIGAEGYLDDLSNPLSFQKNVFDFAVLFEVNYLDFLLGEERMRFSPYLFYGLGFSIYPDASNQTIFAGNIALGTGVKYAVSKKFALGAEVSTRKLFNDELDDLDSPYQTINLEKVSDNLHNNDWIVYFGLTLTYKFYWGKIPCPAYNSIND